MSMSTMRQTTGADEAAVAEALVAALPGPALMAQLHGSDPVPLQALETGVSATYVGPRSADVALILLDRDELIAAGGGDTRVRLGDVLRPALSSPPTSSAAGSWARSPTGWPRACSSPPTRSCST